jgi:hypothetical protein
MWRTSKEKKFRPHKLAPETKVQYGGLVGNVYERWYDAAGDNYYTVRWDNGKAFSVRESGLIVLRAK